MPGLRPMLAAAIAGLVLSACGGPAAAQEIRSDPWSCRHTVSPSRSR